MHICMHMIYIELKEYMVAGQRELCVLLLTKEPSTLVDIWSVPKVCFRNILINLPEIC